MDLIKHLERHIEFSKKTFGPGILTEGIIDHITEELDEIKAEPLDLEEWIDVVMLALDGAWRAGHSPEDIAYMLECKQTKNEARNWPDWTTVDRTKAIGHIKED